MIDSTKSAEDFTMKDVEDFTMNATDFIKNFASQDLYNKNLVGFLYASIRGGIFLELKNKNFYSEAELHNFLNKEIIKEGKSAHYWFKNLHNINESRVLN